ncbi:hypothetical protein GCK72_014931 [Caenorhabditis remanei]|uniref:Acyl_transf_3 domain-containing protein n=1 Tax=Caenorhabditis remanei TaxID=31234 RepID=A0A6A5GVP3_CAERE|nr:hypothetical protein GCK72_014931 [Caenorhabditis remanei]KAF1758473.1 hypothetical protein GCK72_014931 [Caenorhabditis remanei]
MKRDDLQGIRGLAIGAVIAFHFFPRWFPNGYIGVDMFFVLSGFLMTMIFGSKPITSESVYLFYYRRAKRILPLYLAIILIGSLLVFIVYPSTFVPMNMDSAWNSIFLYHNMAEHSDNNLYFKMLNQAEDIFTHTWSLCVEMQFYLLAPIIFLFLSFCTTGSMLTVFHLIIIVTSLGNHLMATEQVAFNSVFCRVWQFLIGSAVYFLSVELIELDTKTIKYTELLLEEQGDSDEEEKEENDEDDEVIFSKPRRNLSRSPLYILLWTSLLFLIFLSFAPWAIPASALRITCTFLSAMIILTGTLCETNPMKNRVLVYIGDISYSLYLVHWPIYVYVKHYYENQFPVYIIGILVSIILAIIISETFEKWYLKLGKQETLFMILICYISIVLIVFKRNEISSFVDNVKYGHEENLMGKVHSSYENITLKQAILLNKKWAREEYKNLVIPNCYPNKTEHGFCEFDKGNLTGDMTVFIVGNSLTPNLGSLVYKTFNNHAKVMYKYSNSYCEILTVASEKRCLKAHDTYEEEVFKKLPDVLFMLDRQDKLRRPIKGPVEKDEIFREALATLRKYENNVKKKIYMLESYTPSTNLPLSKFAQMLEEGKKVKQSLYKLDLSYLNALQRQEELVKKCSKCELIRISDILFNGNQTKNYDEETKLGYYYDGLHITPFAMNLILPLFQKASDNFS